MKFANQDKIVKALKNGGKLIYHPELKYFLCNKEGETINLIKYHIGWHIANNLCEIEEKYENRFSDVVKYILKDNNKNYEQEITDYEL